MLPIAIAFTLTIETFIVSKYNEIKKYLKVFVTITIANLISFLVPYLFTFNELYTLEEVFIHTPKYIIISGYILLTLIFEIPLVTLILKNEVKDKKRLATTVIIANIITTVVAIIERVFFRGSW